MRIIEEISHPAFKISLFSSNSKYLVKLEWGPYEQTFKINELDCPEGITTVKKLLTTEFLLECLAAFKLMQTSWTQILSKNEL